MPPSTVTHARRKGFSLLEMVVVLVVLGILAALAIPTFQSLADNSRDRTAELTLQGVHSAASLLAVAGGRTTYVQGDVDAAVSDLPGYAAAGLSALDAWFNGDGNGDGDYDPGEIYSAISSDAATLALLTRSVSGNLIVSKGTHAGISIWSVGDDCNPTAAEVLDATVGACPVVPPTPSAEFSSLRVGGVNNDSANTVAVLADGSSVVAGSFNDTVSFGATTLTSAGQQDGFVAKLDVDGNWLWAVKLGGTSTDNARAVAAYTDGSVVVAGEFSGTAAFGGTELTSDGGADIFVAKLDSSGDWQWASRAGGTAGDLAVAVDVGSDGSVTVAGSIVSGVATGTATFATSPDATVLTTAGNGDLFVAKLDSSGDWQWASRAGGTGSDSVGSAAFLGDGATVISGAFSGSVTFPTSPATTITSAGSRDVYVAKIDSSGDWQWAERVGGTGWDEAVGAVAIGTDDVVIAGTFSSSTVTFGPDTLTSASYGEGFVARIDAAGDWVWASQTVGTDWSYTSAGPITATADGALLVAGYAQDAPTLGFGAIPTSSTNSHDLFVAKMSADGTWMTATRAGGNSYSQYIMGLAPTAGGGAIAVGEFQEPTTFGDTTLTSVGFRDVFVATVRPNGYF